MDEIWRLIGAFAGGGVFGALIVFVKYSGRITTLETSDKILNKLTEKLDSMLANMRDDPPLCNMHLQTQIDIVKLQSHDKAINDRVGRVEERVDGLESRIL
jgi:hypothetical protein